MKERGGGRGRVGVHRGPALQRNGRYFGSGLNLAARVAAHARAGQILCTRLIAEAGATIGLGCRSRGEVRFKNVPEPVEVFEVVSRVAPMTEHLVDPVCQMQVVRTAHHNVEHGGASYVFCSEECAALFFAQPSNYLPPAR